MAAIKWDQTGERLYETGVNHGVLYVQKADGTYENGVAWNGLTAVTESPDGAEPTDLWADNIKYASLRSAETFGATIEAYTYPDEFAACDGSYAISDGIYIGQQGRTPFAFCYRTELGNDTANEGDDAYKLHIIYNATASPSEKSYETINDSPDVITFSWEIDTTPIAVTDHKPTATLVIDSSKVPEAKMTLILNKLYGTDGAGGSTGTEPTLLTPDQILELIA